MLQMEIPLINVDMCNFKFGCKDNVVEFNDV